MAFDLNSLSTNQPKPPRITVFGGAGVGKTTFAAASPDAVFIITEDGLGSIPATAFPLATSYEDVLEAIGTLYTDDHSFKTLVVDSLDWLEPLIWARVCADNRIENIEKLGYGKGYVEALSYWRTFFDGITALRDKRGMTVVLIAHNEIRRVEDPTMPAFDRHDLKLHKRAAALTEEFSDVILYCCMQTNTVTEDAGFSQKRVRATTTGKRVMHTVGQPAFLAKTRYPMPAVMPLEWDSLQTSLFPEDEAKPEKRARKG